MRVRNHTNPFSVRDRLTHLKWADLVPEKNNVVNLEIGCGRGVFFSRYCQHHPDEFLLGVEVRQVVAEQLHELMLPKNLSNWKIFHSTGEIVLADLVPDRALDAIFIFHPDPWIKKSHHKRRLVKPAFLDSAQAKLKASGKIYFSTHYEPLWDYTKSVVEESAFFEETEHAAFWESDYVTHWQQYSKAQERPSFQGVFQLTSRS